VKGEGSGQGQADAVAGDLQTVSDGGLGHAGAAEHADAAGLAHRQQVNHGNQQQQGQQPPPNKREGHFFRSAWVRLGTRLIESITGRPAGSQQRAEIGADFLIGTTCGAVIRFDRVGR